jgi:hypothetical protein
MRINVPGFVILVWALLGTTNLHAQQSQSIDAGKALVSSLEINEGYPSKETSQRLYDELQFQQAVQVYLWAQPAMSLYSVRQELTKKFNANPTTIPTWKDRVTAKSILVTANSEVVYTLHFLDLKKDGPTVIEFPPQLQGLIDDMWHRPITDVGAAGPDKGKGGKYLFLPPGYQGEIPDGYFAFPSKTYGIFVFMRGFMKDGTTDHAVKLMEQMKVYPLARKDNPPETKFPNATDVPINTLAPADASYFSNLAKFIDDESVEQEHMTMRGMMASLGIVKGKSFQPDARMQTILDRAAKVADGMARTLAYDTRSPLAKHYKEDSKWELCFQSPSPLFVSETYQLFNERAAFFFPYYSTSDGMVVEMVGKGSKYLATFKDAEGNWLSGSNTYKLRIPANPPVGNYWSFTLYDTDTRGLLQNGQPFPAVNSYGDIKKNKDGSIDIYISPKAPKGWESNWVQSVPGKGWFPAFRFYSPTEAYFDKSWKLSDIEKVQ